MTTKVNLIPQNQNILITGGAGFIGSNLCEHFLNLGCTIFCLDNFSTGKRENIETFLSNDKFKLLEKDIRDFESCLRSTKGIDIILHQAALGSVPRSIADPITTNSVNVDGFLNILEAARINNVKRFVYAASSSTYGDSKELPKIEERIGAPLSPYAVTKYVNELYARVYSDLHGMEIIGLRYFNVFGKRQDPNGAYAAAIPKFIKALLNHESPVIHGDGSQSRDFTYIQNVIHANELAATTTNKDALGEVYNIAFGNSTTVNELIHQIKTHLAEFDSNVIHLNPLHESERKGDVKHSLASIEKAKKMLNYQPQHSLSQGLNEAILWYWKNLK